MEGGYATADNPLMPAVGAKHFGQSRQIVLFVPEDPAAMADALVGWGGVLRTTRPRDVAAGHAEPAGGTPSGLGDLLGVRAGKSQTGVADRAERWHRADQQGRTSTGQKGEPGPCGGGPVADSVVDPAVLSRRADQGQEMSDGEVVGVGEAVQVGADRLAVNGRRRERQRPQPGGHAVRFSMRVRRRRARGRFCCSALSSGSTRSSDAR